MLSRKSLNVDQYSIEELEDIFGLKNNVYGQDEIAMREQKKLRMITTDYTIPPDVKQDLIRFLGQARNKLGELLQQSLLLQQNALQTNISAPVPASTLFNTNLTLQPSPTTQIGSSEIIQQQPAPYVQSQHNDFQRGKLNPLEIHTIRKNLNIDTRFRNPYYNTPSSNFNVTLPMRFTNVLTMQLTAMEFPGTFYMISHVFQNNSFLITIDDTSQLITIPDGNYNYIDFQQYLNNYVAKFADSSDPAIQKFAQITFNIDISGLTSGSGKMVIGTSADPPFDFTVNFQIDKNGNPDTSTPLPLKLGWLMGFRSGSYTNNSAYVSEGIVDLLGIKYIYLVVDDHNNNVNDGFYGAFSESILNKNILARISLQGSAFKQTSQNNLELLTNSRQYFGPVNVEKLHIQLLDEYGRVLDLNNMDYSFCLSFQIKYDI